MRGAISVEVLGPLRITIDGEVADHPAEVAPLIIALAVADRPLLKLELAREISGHIAPQSIDSRLSRLHRLLGLDKPLHRVPVARSGLVELDDSSVAVDADQFRSLVAQAESLTAPGRVEEALDRLLRADDLGETAQSRGNGSETHRPGRRWAALGTTCCRVGGGSGSRQRAWDRTVLLISHWIGCCAGRATSTLRGSVGTRAS